MNLRERLVEAIFRLPDDDEKFIDHLRNVARIGRRLAFRREDRRLMDRLLWAVDNDHCAVRIARRLIREASPGYREGLVTLFADHSFAAGPQRRKFHDAHGVWPPSFVVISPLANCNLRCVGCYAGADGKLQPHLSYDDLARLVEEVREWGTRFVTVSGGEPVMFWRHIRDDKRGLRDLIREYSDMVFLMYTNGTLCDDEMAAEMAEMGNVTPGISLEGYAEQTDARRGPGVYDQVMAAMEKLRRHRALFGASVTYTSQNVDVVGSDEYVDYLVELGCLYAWYFMYIPVGRDPDLSLMVAPEQRKRMALTTYNWLNTRPIFVADFWNSGWICKGCIAGGRPHGYLHVNHRGDICPCVFMQYSKHNVHTSDSRTPLLDAIKSDFFEMIRQGQLHAEKNPLAPCHIVDHPETLKRAVEATDAQPTQEGQTVLTDLHEAVMERAAHWSGVADELWTKSGVYKGLVDDYAGERFLTPG